MLFISVTVSDLTRPLELSALLLTLPASRLVVLGLIVTVGSLACSDFAPLHGMSVPFLSENNNNNNSNKSLHGILQIQIQNDSLKALSGILQIQIQNDSLKALSGILQIQIQN